MLIIINQFDTPFDDANLQCGFSKITPLLVVVVDVDDVEVDFKDSILSNYNFQQF
jgi:hypothetical protein